MPGSVRKDDKARRIALDILGPHPAGLVDSYGNKKKYRKKKKRDDERIPSEGDSMNRFDEVGLRY